MGILANHVPSIEAIRPGLVEVIESNGTSKKFFGALNCFFFWGGGEYTDIPLLASGGFATVHPNNKLTINVIEAAPLEEFSPEARFRFLVAVIMAYCCIVLTGYSCQPPGGLAGCKWEWHGGRKD